MTSEKDANQRPSLIKAWLPTFFQAGKRLRKISMTGEIRKVFKHKLTVMIVPHNTLGRFNLQFTFSFAIFFMAFSAAMFTWATMAVVSNIDYWEMRTEHQILKLKVQYFAAELRKNREVLERVKEADLQLRQLLQMKDRQAIIDGETSQGGPEAFEQSILEKTLSKRLWEISDSEIRLQAKALHKESLQRLKSYKELSEYIANERGLSRAAPLGWPAEGRTTSRFGERVSPIHGGPQFHAGVDIANNRGTPVRATGDGIVELAGWEGGYGRLVVLNHGFGYKTYYGHNSVLLVKPGEAVRRGQTIAYMGSTGSSTGNHTHYEVWHDGRPANPWKFMAAESAEQLKFGRKYIAKAP